MNFLKKHGFAVGLGVLSLGALVLLWVMVFGKIFAGERSMSAALKVAGEIQEKYKRYGDPKRTKVVPSAEAEKVMKAAKKKADEAVAAGVGYYDSKRDRFDALHDDYGSTVDDAAGFRGFYLTMMAALRADYRKAFAAAAEAPPAPGEAPPGAEAGAAPAPAEAAPAAAKDSRDELPHVVNYPTFNNADDVKRAMKELWIVSEVIAKLTELKAGGLQDISFPDRVEGARGGPSAAAAAKEAEAKEYKWLRAKVVVAMPFGQVDPFLAKLLESDRVPFRLDALTVVRPREAVLTKSYEIGEYLDVTQRDKAPVEKIAPEPPVRVTFELGALSWIGAAEPK